MELSIQFKNIQKPFPKKNISTQKMELSVIFHDFPTIFPRFSHVFPAIRCYRRLLLARLPGPGGLPPATAAPVGSAQLGADAQQALHQGATSAGGWVAWDGKGLELMYF